MGCSRVALAAFLVAAAVGLVVSGCVGANPLDGTEWKLTGWSVSSIDPASVTITAEFGDRQIWGSSGVNSYGGPVEVGARGGFVTGRLAATQMAGPEPAMRAESAFLTLLAEAKSYKVAGTTLTLYGSGGNESLIFTRVGE